MVISDIYSTGLHQRNIGHFANIVKLALLDKKIDLEEHILLKKLAYNLDIDRDEFKAILKNPNKFPVNPPVSYSERIERLYNLTRMLFLAKSSLREKRVILNRVAIGLGFPIENSKKIVEVAVKFFAKEPDIEEFKAQIKSLKG
jgi:hypothetical protein